MKIKFLQLIILMFITLEFLPEDAFEHNKGSMLMKNFVSANLPPMNKINKKAHDKIQKSKTEPRSCDV